MILEILNFFDKSGPIGLVCAMVAKAFGARKVVMSDVREERLTFAKKVVADSVVLIKSSVLKLFFLLTLINDWLNR